MNKCMRSLPVLILAAGAGALSRKSIGAVVFFGVSFSVVLTLVVVPAVYGLIARNSHSPEYVGQLIDKLKAGGPLGPTTHTSTSP